MARCLELAQKGWGNTHPNPMVGAVIVEDGRIVAEGWHEQAGRDHAEVAALKSLGRLPKPGGSLICTLEPCSTTGRTGPCTEAIVQAGLRHVVIGSVDPNPEHSGTGIEWLKEHGVSVETGVLADDCDDLIACIDAYGVQGGDQRRGAAGRGQAAFGTEQLGVAGLEFGDIAAATAAVPVPAAQDFENPGLPGLAPLGPFGPAALVDGRAAEHSRFVGIGRPGRRRAADS